MYLVYSVVVFSFNKYSVQAFAYFSITLLKVEESDHAKMAVANSFAIYGGNKCILVAAK